MKKSANKRLFHWLTKKKHTQGVCSDMCMHPHSTNFEEAFFIILLTCVITEELYQTPSVAVATVHTCNISHCYLQSQYTNLYLEAMDNGLLTRALSSYQSNTTMYLLSSVLLLRLICEDQGGESSSDLLETGDQAISRQPAITYSTTPMVTPTQVRCGSSWQRLSIAEMAFLSFSATHSVEALDKTKNEVNSSCFHFVW